MRNLAHIFILMSFIAGVIAPACGFSWGGTYSVIEICTNDGIENRIVKNSNNHQNAPQHHASEQCQFCFQNANLDGSLAPTSKTVHQYALKSKNQFEIYQSVFLSKAKSAQSQRGPPSFI